MKRGVMSLIKVKAEIHFKADTDEYAVPADDNLSLQIKEDLQEAIESSLPFEINAIKVTRTGVKNDQVRDYNQD